MSEPKYPRVYGFWAERSGRFADDMRKNRSEAESESNSDEIVIELIPLPEHQAIVAAAVAAERERIIGIVRSINPCDVEDVRPTFAGATLRHVLSKLCEVPK